MPLRRTGTVPDAGARYGPGSAAHRSASATRCAASGAPGSIPAMMAMPVTPGAGTPPGVAVVPAAVAIAAAGIGIARSLILAVGVRIELRAVAGIVDHFLRRRRACQRC